MKSFRLIVHQKTFSEDDLIISQKDCPNAQVGDIVEIYHPPQQQQQLHQQYDDLVGGAAEKVVSGAPAHHIISNSSQQPVDEFPRLLLQIKVFRDEMLQTRDTISVEQSIANTFGLQPYKNVVVRLVNAKDVSLDSIELTFKDQYMGRSEMWRLKNSLTNTCVYMNKKMEFCGGAVRCQVYEMWAQGDRVACGVINDDTKVVFRSSTSMVYLFLQMSSEMWDFDIHGDLYFEKAVNGFLADLFLKWKKNGSNHEVTIVLFSRTFYEANSLEEFPLHMRECLQKDYKGRYYEDFYRVAVQNERYDDWSGILVQLRRIFSQYLKMVLEYHSKPNVIHPVAVNSTAAQGNFLEVLNMSLNVFEKHYLDRSFDRTGQLSVVVTPGVGVFEVDRELTNITKQRIIDNGVGSDLVCVGEQPLHAVPLLKFHNKDTHLNVPDDYSMPHWINLSFYSSNKKIAYSNFIPRIKLPPALFQSNNNNNDNSNNNRKKRETKTSTLMSASDANTDDSNTTEYCMHNTAFFDYDAYDAQVFQLPATLMHQHQYHNMHQNHDQVATTEKITNNSLAAIQNNRLTQKYRRTVGHLLQPEELRGVLQRQLSDPYLNTRYIDSKKASSNPITIPNVGNNSDNNEEDFSPPANSYEHYNSSISNFRKVVGSEGSPPLESRALINPFDPSHVTIKLTSNRRRWTHIFPKGPTGVLIQQHHYQAIPAQTQDLHNNNNSLDNDVIEEDHHHDHIDKKSKIVNNTTTTSSGSNQLAKNYRALEALREYCNKRPNNYQSIPFIPPKNSTKSLTLLWGATGEQEWTPALTTGVDWKSLTIPACLPITTDYFPDKRALNIDYVVSLYSLLPDSVNADFAQQRSVTNKRPLTTIEVFRELISQRLAQGFQLILMGDNNNVENKNLYRGTSSVASNSNTSGQDDETAYYLSIGRLFHKISLSGNTISVTRYRPRHPYPGFKYQYRYRFYAPHHGTYEESYASFTTEKLEHYNWNYLDHYVCTGGDTEFVLVDALKYWRFRVYLLPLNNAATKKIIEGAEHCDIYTKPTPAENQQMIEGFLKFIETVVNKIKRNCVVSKKPRMSLININNAPLIQPRRNSMSNFLINSQNVGSNSPFRERLGSNRLSDRPRPRSGSKVMERNSRLSQSSQDSSMEGHHSEAADESGASSTAPSIVLLKATATNLEIIEAMKQQQPNGLSFINPQSNLPPLTFITADAVAWLMMHVESIANMDKAIGKMQDLHRDNLIRHASGDRNRPFIYGFYLFYIVSDDKEDYQSAPPYNFDSQMFENEWFEAEIRPPLNWGLNRRTNGDRDQDIPHFLCDDIDVEYADCDLLLMDTQTMYKRMRLETDVQSKSDRVEWGHARYQTVFRPDMAYELVVEWLTSSGSIVAELLSGWHRKASQGCGLQMIPIPHDPLALPYSNKSDPLRGPIFIPLDISCLDEPSQLFKEFREDEATSAERLFLLQEAIVQRFGFIHCLVESQCNNANSGATATSVANSTNTSREHQYIHATGTVFILISVTATPKPRNRLNSASQRYRPSGRYSVHADVVPSPHEAYITRHVSGKNKDDYDNSRKMGFLWSWNHMISRRWRTNQGVDNNFQTKFLKDFRDFCSNVDNRLKNFWEECWEAKEAASATNSLRSTPLLAS